MWIDVLLTTAVAVVTSVVFAWVANRRKLRPHESTEIDGAMRAPKSGAVVGWIMVAVGLVMVLGALVFPEDGEVAVLVLFGLSVAGVGAFFIIRYLNFFIMDLDDEIVRRTWTRKVTRIRYDSVKSVKIYPAPRSPSLRIRGLNGNRIDATSNIIDTVPILAKIEFFQQANEDFESMPPPTSAPLG